MGLRAAREHVRIRTPYFLPGDELRRAMADAVARGVRVQVLLPGPSNDSRLVRLASRTRYADYLAGGLELYEFQPRMMHAKSVTVDGRLALLGSHNVDHRSLRLSFEFSFAVDDPALVAAMDRAFDDDVTEARAMDDAAVAARGALERIAGGAVGVIEGYL
jgi:cardiolipin synthase